MQRVSSVSNHFRGSASTTANDAPVLFNYTGNVCKVTLNRPKHLNALNVEMDKLLRSELRQWNQSSNPKVAIFSGAGGKSFSAGGDVKSLHEAGGRGDYAFFDEFYREEYGAILDCAKMKPIQVSLWDGFVMGAGAAISVYAPIKIATEKAVFAMPEAKIGLFTDVSAGYFLSRLRGNIGVFLALTATRLKGEELVQVGIADHFVRSEKLPSLEREIIESTTSKTTLEDLKAIVRKYEEPVERKYKNEEFIQATFGKSSVEEIHNTLKQATQNKEFANELVSIMESMPPLSLKIMLEQMQRGRKLNLGEVLAMEMRIVHRFMQEKDFYEGVRCTLINKGDKPKWSHKSLTDVSKEEVEQHFDRLPEHQEFKY